MTGIVNRSAPRGDVVAVLLYEDVPTAAAWLCNVFGFEERLRAGNGHAQLDVGVGSVMLSAARVGQSPEWNDRAELRPPRAGDAIHQSVLVRVGDVDRHHQHARSRGARILDPPTDYPFGERQYTAEDLAGHRWSFSQSIADVDPRDWGATVAAGMADQTAAGVVLVALLYLHPGRSAEYERFEAAASRIMARHGGRIARRMKLPGGAPAAVAGGALQPDEIHVVHFPDSASFARYRADPEIASLAELRAAAIRDTVIWQGNDAPPFDRE